LPQTTLVGYRLSGREFCAFNSAFIIQPNEDLQRALAEGTAILITAIGVYSLEPQTLQITQPFEP
jgi:hypothetical protein